MALKIQINEVVDNNYLRRLNEVGFKIVGAAGKSRVTLSALANWSFKITSRSGQIKIYDADGVTLLGTTATLNSGTQYRIQFYIELPEGQTDYLTVSGYTSIAGLGRNYTGLFIANGCKMEEITPDFLRQFKRSVITEFNVSGNTFVGFTSFKDIAILFPNIRVFTSYTSKGILSAKCSDFSSLAQLSTLLVQNTPTRGDIIDLPASLQNITLPSADLSCSSDGLKFTKLNAVSVSFWSIDSTSEQSLIAANNFIKSASKSEWTGSKTLKVLCNFLVTDFDADALAMLNAKGVTVTIAAS